MSNKAKIKKYFDVTKERITLKVPARIVLNLLEYRDIDSNYGEMVGIEDIETVYKIPGFFTVEFPEENDSISFFFPYSVYLNKTESIEVSSKEIIIDFQPDDLLLYVRYKDSDTDIRVVKSLFENGAKYLGNSPDKLISSIWTQLNHSTNVPFHHLEVLISQLYGIYDKNTKEFKPLRLSSEPYNKKFIMSIKESAHNLNPILGFSYGYSKDALRTSVSKKKRQQNSFYEDIISGDFEALEKYSK